MAPPPVTIYVTSLTSQPRVRQYTELLHRSLKGLEIPYESFDLVMDPEAKTRWQRSKPSGMVIGLPGFLVGGEWAGTMEDFEQAVESGTLPSFLKQDQEASQPGEGELEKLMRGMTDSDLDKLSGELGEGDVGKTGLISGPPEEGSGGREEGLKMEEKPSLSLGLDPGKAEVGEALRSAGTVDGLIAVMERVEGKEKVD